MTRNRERSTPTKYPGVRRIASGQFQIRARYIDPKTGRTAEINRAVRATNEREAAAIRAAEIEDAKAGRRAAEIPRLQPYAESWFRTIQPRLKPSTRWRYVYALEAIAAELGDHYLDQIADEDVAALRDRWAASVAPSTINGRLGVLRRLSADAADRYAIRDFARRVPTLPEKRKDRCLTTEELGRLLRAAEAVAPSWYPLIATLALTGMRTGEATALRWEDVDFTNHTITVQRSHWRGTIGTTKTGTVRAVPMAAELEQILRDHRRRQMADQVAGFGAGWIFASSTGTLRNSGALTKPLRKARKAAGIDKPVSAHWLRHTFSNEARRVAGRQIQKAMTGHTTDRMAEHYSSVRLDETLAVAAQIAAGVFRSVVHPNPPLDDDD